VHRRSARVRVICAASIAAKQAASSGSKVVNAAAISVTSTMPVTGAWNNAGEERGHADDGQRPRLDAEMRKRPRRTARRTPTRWKSGPLPRNSREIRIAVDDAPSAQRGRGGAAKQHQHKTEGSVVTGLMQEGIAPRIRLF
jgi:hypothetical protein